MNGGQTWHEWLQSCSIWSGMQRPAGLHRGHLIGDSFIQLAVLEYMHGHGAWCMSTASIHSPLHDPSMCHHLFLWLKHHVLPSGGIRRLPWDHQLFPEYVRLVSLRHLLADNVPVWNVSLPSTSWSKPLAFFSISSSPINESFSCVWFRRQASRLKMDPINILKLQLYKRRSSQLTFLQMDSSNLFSIEQYRSTKEVSKFIEVSSAKKDGNIFLLQICASVREIATRMTRLIACSHNAWILRHWRSSSHFLTCELTSVSNFSAVPVLQSSCTLGYTAGITYCAASLSAGSAKQHNFLKQSDTRTIFSDPGPLKLFFSANMLQLVRRIDRDTEVRSEQQRS